MPKPKWGGLAQNSTYPPHPYRLETSNLSKRVSTALSKGDNIAPNAVSFRLPLFIAVLMPFSHSFFLIFLKFEFTFVDRYAYHCLNFVCRFPIYVWTFFRTQIVCPKLFVTQIFHMNFQQGDYAFERALILFNSRTVPALNHNVMIPVPSVHFPFPFAIYPIFSALNTCYLCAKLQLLLSCW